MFGVTCLSGQDFHECSSSQNCSQYKGQCTKAYEGVCPPHSTCVQGYSTHIYTQRAQSLINDWKTGDPPMFIYLAWQAVHEPLDVPEHYLSPFGGIEDPSRRIYAGMLAALDEGIGNITKTLEQQGQDVIVVLSNDNGGMSGSYGLGCCNCGTSCG